MGRTVFPPDDGWPYPARVPTEEGGRAKCLVSRPRTNKLRRNIFPVGYFANAAKYIPITPASQLKCKTARTPERADYSIELARICNRPVGGAVEFLLFSPSQQMRRIVADRKNPIHSIGPTSNVACTPLPLNNNPYITAQHRNTARASYDSIVNRAAIAHIPLAVSHRRIFGLFPAPFWRAQ